MNMPSNRVAIITGAAKGIGRAIALRLADDGLDIVVNGLPTSQDKLDEVVKEIQAKGRKALAVTGDVSSESDVQNMIDVTVKEFGGFDVMIANAGIIKVASFMDTSVDLWDRTFSVNVRGTFLCYQAAAAQLIKQGRGGRIIGACSTSGKGGPKYYSAYASTKFAIRGLTQSVAQELGSHGITVNTYAPGGIDTDMLTTCDREYCELEGLPTGSYLKAGLAMLPCGKLGTPEDIAALVSYIASPESKYLTGQSLNINGGLVCD